MNLRRVKNFFTLLILTSAIAIGCADQNKNDRDSSGHGFESIRGKKTASPVMNDANYKEEELVSDEEFLNLISDTDLSESDLVEKIKLEKNKAIVEVLNLGEDNFYNLTVVCNNFNALLKNKSDLMMYPKSKIRVLRNSVKNKKMALVYCKYARGDIKKVDELITKNRVKTRNLKSGNFTTVNNIKFYCGDEVYNFKDGKSAIYLAHNDRLVIRVDEKQKPELDEDSIPNSDLDIANDTAGEQLKADSDSGKPGDNTNLEIDLKKIIRIKCNSKEKK